MAAIAFCVVVVGHFPETKIWVATGCNAVLAGAVNPPPPGTRLAVVEGEKLSDRRLRQRTACRWVRGLTKRRKMTSQTC